MRRAQLPRGAGTALFAGGGAWLETTSSTERPGRGDDALFLSDPLDILVAQHPQEVTSLLHEVTAQQQSGRYVAGFLTYEAGAAFGFTVRPRAADALPLAWMAVYEPERVIRLGMREWESLLAQVDVARVASALAGVKPRLSVSPAEYDEAIRRAREYIAAGDTYQVNYTVRGYFELSAAEASSATRPTEQVLPIRPTGQGLTIDPLDYFLALVVRQPVPYAAFLDLGEAQIISLSPEMFLRRRGTCLESRPMKGTRPRGTTHAEDVALAYELAESEKERAENLMIVDMVRNDLGRICRPGSVRVPALYVLEPYRTVWQMTSTVSGQVNPRATLAEIMAAVFPGASITGAPKHHTMEIIAELETEPRDIYTGTLGLFLPGGDFTANIAIRTIVHRNGHCRLGTGSGVVWDAAAAAEYEETLAKAAFATPPSNDTWLPNPARQLRVAAQPAARTAESSGFCLFETMLLKPVHEVTPMTGTTAPAISSPSMATSPANPSTREAALARYLFLDEHLDRMAASAEVLGLPFDREQALVLLLAHAQAQSDAQAVRLALGAEEGFTLSARPAPTGRSSQAGASWGTKASPGAVPLSCSPAPVSLLVSPFRTDPADPFLFHKTSRRGLYDREHRRALNEGCFDALFLNRLDRVTEGAITNLFARFGQRWVTPPLEDGLLPGIWRAYYLAQTKAEEVTLSLQDLLVADEIVVGNSVRGAFRVDRLLADPLTF